MSSGKRVFILAAVAALALSAGGCVDRDVSGDAATYSFSWWVPTVALVAAVIAFPVGLLLRGVRGKARLGWGLMILSPVIGVALVPGLFLDRVKVDSRHFEASVGFWFAPTEHDVAFENLAEIRHVTYETRGRRGRKNTKHKFVCLRVDGTAHTVELGDLLRRAAPEIMSRAKDQGIHVSAMHE